MDVSQVLPFVRYEAGRFHPAEDSVVREGLVRLHVNGQELVRLMCSPYQLDLLALGFLASEGIINSREDVRLIKVCPSGACVDVWLRRADFEPPSHPTLTSGCGGGITFADLTQAAEPIDSDVCVSPGQLRRLLRALLVSHESRGIHRAGLADGEELLAVVEDVGRHNTIDKLWGMCLSKGIDVRDRILLSSGRISSEMLNKAARMRVPVVASRTSPTSLSIALADAWNVTLVGYVRRDSLNVYAGQARVVVDQEERTDADL